MIFSSTAILWFLFFAASGCAFMVGRKMVMADQDDIIESTIMYMVDNNLVKYTVREDGEIELQELNDN